MKTKKSNDYDYKEIIQSKGIKLSWIGEQLGLSQPYFSMKVNGHRNFNPKEEKLLKKLLNLK